MTEKRKWQTGENIEIDALTLFRESRKYTFKEMNQEHGSQIFHYHVMVIIEHWEKMKTLVDEFKKARGSNFKKDGDFTIKDMLEQAGIIAKILPSILSWDEVKKLSKMLLADHSVEIIEGDEPKTYTAGEDGFSGVKGDPLEVYHAIAYSMLANWPKYIVPLLQAAGRFDPRFRAGTKTEQRASTIKQASVEHSLSLPVLEMLQVAEWWSESPDTVGAWGCRKFADRQEYMFLQVEKKLDIHSSTPNQIPLEPGEVPYTGPKNRK